MYINKRRVQEGVGFNKDEKQKIKDKIREINKNAKRGDIKVTFSSFVRVAALEKAE